MNEWLVKQVGAYIEGTRSSFIVQLCTAISVVSALNYLTNNWLGIIAAIIALVLVVWAKATD